MNEFDKILLEAYTCLDNGEITDEEFSQIKEAVDIVNTRDDNNDIDSLNKRVTDLKLSIYEAADQGFISDDVKEDLLSMLTTEGKISEGLKSALNKGTEATKGKFNAMLNKINDLKLKVSVEKAKKGKFNEIMADLNALKVGFATSVLYNDQAGATKLRNAFKAACDDVMARLDKDFNDGVISEKEHKKYTDKVIKAMQYVKHPTRGKIIFDMNK